MKCTIERADNGYIVSHEDADGRAVHVFEFRGGWKHSESEPEVFAFRSALWAIDSMIGPTTNKYSRRRVVIRVVRGSDYIEPEGEKP